MLSLFVLLSKLIKYVKKVLHVISNFQVLFKICTFWSSSILMKRQAYRPILILTFLFKIIKYIKKICVPLINKLLANKSVLL